MNITEKSAYIKGLAEGLGLDASKPETKVINALLDLVSDLSAKIAELEKETETLNDYIEEIDEDLGFVEDLIYDDDDEDEDDDDDEDDYECDLDCAHCSHAEDCEAEDEDDEEDDGDDEEGFRCLMCPSCGERIYFDESIDPADLICPACGKVVCEEEDEDAEDVM
ncbi:MAG: hypothetical protein IJD06_11400 [Clostridia bacterium]|nr:hypothetical protein [Clostridia bacterium]